MSFCCAVTPKRTSVQAFWKVNLRICRFLLFYIYFRTSLLSLPPIPAEIRLAKIEIPCFSSHEETEICAKGSHPSGSLVNALFEPFLAVTPSTVGSLPAVDSPVLHSIRALHWRGQQHPCWSPLAKVLPRVATQMLQQTGGNSRGGGWFVFFFFFFPANFPGTTGWQFCSCKVLVLVSLSLNPLVYSV